MFLIMKKSLQSGWTFPFLWFGIVHLQFLASWHFWAVLIYVTGSF